MYQNYVAECLRIATENTAKSVAWLSRGEEQCSYISVSFDDILNPKPVEEKTADEIIDEIQAEFDRLGFENNNKLQKIGGENT